MLKLVPEEVVQVDLIDQVGLVKENKVAANFQPKFVEVTVQRSTKLDHVLLDHGLSVLTIALKLEESREVQQKLHDEFGIDLL